MVCGLSGPHMNHVQSHVVVEPTIDIEHAPIQPLNMEEKTALDQARTPPEAAIRHLAQVRVSHDVHYYRGQVSMYI